MGEEDDVGRGLQAEVPERLQQHGQQVHQVELQTKVRENFTITEMASTL